MAMAPFEFPECPLASRHNGDLLPMVEAHKGIEPLFDLGLIGNLKQEGRAKFALAGQQRIIDSYNFV